VASHPVWSEPFCRPFSEPFVRGFAEAERPGGRWVLHPVTASASLLVEGAFSSIRPFCGESLPGRLQSVGWSRIDKGFPAFLPRIRNSANRMDSTRLGRLKSVLEHLEGAAGKVLPRGFVLRPRLPVNHI
jgi:hypothetical protein